MIQVQISVIGIDNKQLPMGLLLHYNITKWNTDASRKIQQDQPLSAIFVGTIKDRFFSPLAGQLESTRF